MIKVLQIGMNDTLGGIESYLINYERNIDKSKICFDYVDMTEKGICFRKEIENAGNKIYQLPNYRRRPILYMRKLLQLLKKNKYDIIHCNMNSAVFLYPLIVAKMAKVKVIIAHSHNASSDKGILKTILHNVNKHFIPLFANNYFACSKLAGEWFFSKKIIESNRFFIINNGIEVEKYQFDLQRRKNKRKELGINDDTVVIGHIGRFSKQKNHSFLIDAFYKAYQKNSNIVLLLIGIGPLQEKMKNKVKQLKIEKNVIFLEQREDANDLYKVFDIFALPSLYEGLPLVGIEAQCSGCHCLFSDHITKELNQTAFSHYKKIEKTDEWEQEFSKFKINTEIRKDVNIEKFDIKINAKKIFDIYKYTTDKER